MRTHVPAIGQQRHRVVPPARHDFDDHRRGGDPHHHERTALGDRTALVEDVVVNPSGYVFRVHG